MALDTAGRRRRRLSMTSLIDVIFLLLLFFMLTSTFSKYGEVRLSSAGQRRGMTDTDDVRPVFIRLGQSEVSLDGIPATFEDLEHALFAKDIGEAKPHILISPQLDVSAQRLVDLLALMRNYNWPITVLQ